MKSVDEEIRRAMEEGRFNNLPGKGKPLHLEENPFEDPGWRMAHHILRTSGFSLPWIETRREILSELEEQRAALARAWGWRQAACSAKWSPAVIEKEWKQAVEKFGLGITALNQRISSYNLETSSAQFLLPLINLERELANYASHDTR